MLTTSHCSGDAGYLSQVEIDTAHFMGNFPESCEMHALHTSDLVPSDVPEDHWTLILPRTKLGPHRRHFFQLENVVRAAYTHVKITIYPDGGIKRVRVLGRRARPINAAGDAQAAPLAEEIADDGGSGAASAHPDALPARTQSARGPLIPALPLTPEAFAPFGKVVQAYADVNAVPDPRNTRVTGANQGTATKFHKLALLEASYPPGANATAGLSVYRCAPIDVRPGGEWEVKLLERHPCTNQAFIPMGGGVGLGDALEEPGTTYLVIVAQNGADDKPALSTMRAFVASAGQGIVYDTGIWRESPQPGPRVLVCCTVREVLTRLLDRSPDGGSAQGETPSSVCSLHGPSDSRHHPCVPPQTMDFTCVETQIGNGDKLDCEVVDLDGAAGYCRVQVPS